MSVPRPPDVSEIERRALAAGARYEARTSDPAPSPGDLPLSPIVVRDAQRVDETLPRRYRDALPSRDETWSWLDVAGDGAGLLLAGPTGTGKTHEAYGAIRAWAAAGWAPGARVLFGNAADLLDRCRPDGDLSVNALATADLLLLDDLGAFKATDWTAEALYRIVDRRWAEMLPTLATTNMPPPDLSAFLGDRLASRLVGTYRVVPMTGGDRRRGT